MIDLKDLKDITLNSYEYDTLKYEIKTYGSILEGLEEKKEISICVKELLNDILENKPERKDSNWFMENEKWVVNGTYEKSVTFYDGTNHKLYNKILELLKEIGIDATLSKIKTHEFQNISRYTYFYTYKISYDDYNMIKEYLNNLENRMDEELKHKLFRLEVNSWPEWKKKYYDKNFVKTPSKKLTDKHN